MRYADRDKIVTDGRADCRSRKWCKKSGTLANHLLEEAGLSNRIKGMRGGSLLGCQTFFVSVLRRVFFGYTVTEIVFIIPT